MFFFWVCIVHFLSTPPLPLSLMHLFCPSLFHYLISSLVGLFSLLFFLLKLNCKCKRCCLLFWADPKRDGRRCWRWAGMEDPNKWLSKMWPNQARTNFWLLWVFLSSNCYANCCWLLPVLPSFSLSWRSPPYPLAVPPFCGSGRDRIGKLWQQLKVLCWALEKMPNLPATHRQQLPFVFSYFFFSLRVKKVAINIFCLSAMHSNNHCFLQGF